jgi:hypothetical protein
MPASRLIAGMARSYGCPAISFTDKWLTQKVGCIEGARINQHAVFRIIMMRNFGR